MIKRRFYRLERGGRDDASDSSISSDSEPEAQATEESEDDVEDVDEADGSCSTSSGYVSEDSSVNEVDADLSGLTSHKADDGNENERQTLIESKLPGITTLGVAETQSDISSVKEALPTDIPVCILKCKSVFKCRICPRVVCLNEETLRSHLKSKRHARSEKLLSEGRLKIMLNSNGEIGNPEDLTDSPPRVPAFPLENRKRTNKSRPRFGQQTKRVNKRGKKHLNFQKGGGSTNSLIKKRPKFE